MGTGTQQNGSPDSGLAGHPLTPISQGKVILQSVMGSQAYGMATPDSDYDRLGVFVTPRKKLTGLHIPKDTVVRAGPDYTYHEVGKFVRLVLKCNPTLVELLFVENPEICTDEGQILRGNRDSFLSAPRVLGAFGGYAMEQINRLQRRGDGTFSSDTAKRRMKHARHTFRLLWQGKELLETGSLTVRLPEDRARLLFDIGEMDDQDMVTAFQQEDALLKQAFETSVLPEEANFDRVANLLDIIRDLSE